MDDSVGFPTSTRRHTPTILLPDAPGFVPTYPPIHNYVQSYTNTGIHTHTKTHTNRRLHPTIQRSNDPTRHRSDDRSVLPVLSGETNSTEQTKPKTPQHQHQPTQQHDKQHERGKKGERRTQAINKPHKNIPETKTKQNATQHNIPPTVCSLHASQCRPKRLQP